MVSGPVMSLSIVVTSVVSGVGPVVVSVALLVFGCGPVVPSGSSVVISGPVSTSVAASVVVPALSLALAPARAPSQAMQPAPVRVREPVRAPALSLALGPVLASARVPVPVRAWYQPGMELLLVQVTLPVAGSVSKKTSYVVAGEDAGSLNIATTHTQARYVLPPAVVRLREAFPGVRLQLRQGTPAQIVAHGEAAHLFYDGPVENHNFKDFEYECEVLTKTKANSGMYFHTKYQPKSWPTNGIEVQVNQTHGDPKKVGIWATYHPDWTKEDRFVEQTERLREKGVSFSVGVVGYLTPDTVISWLLTSSVSPDLVNFRSLPSTVFAVPMSSS